MCSSSKTNEVEPLELLAKGEEPFCLPPLVRVNQYGLVCMIIVTNTGCHYRMSLVKTCLRYPTYIILLTSLKLSKKIHKRLLLSQFSRSTFHEKSKEKIYRVIYLIDAEFS